MTTKKWLSLVLAAMLLVSLIPASLSEAAPTALSVAVWDIDNAFPADGAIDAMKQTFYDRFNITIEPWGITWGDFNDKYTTWATKALPDVSGGLDIIGSGKYYQWIEDGLIRALPDDLSAYPNVEKYVNLSEVQAYKVDGKNYFLPRMTYIDPVYWAMDRGILYRKDWAEKLNIAPPESAEEFLAMLEAFTNSDPDGNGVKDTVGLTAGSVTIVDQFFANYGYIGGFWHLNGDKYVIPNVEEGPLPVVDMVRRAYKVGAMDQDYAAYTNADPAIEKFVTSRAGVFANQVSPKHIKNIYDKWQELSPELDFFECVGILPMWEVEGRETTVFAEKSFWSETYIGAQVSDEKLHTILSIFDYMYSEEGMLFFAYGIEGEDYEMVDGAINILLPMNENGTQMKLTDKYAFANGIPALACWTGDMLQYVNPTIPKGILDMCNAELENRKVNWVRPDLDWEVVGINVPEKQEATYVTKQLWNVIIMDGSDTTTEELYEDMKVELEAGGYYAVVEAVNKAAKDMGK